MNTDFQSAQMSLADNEIALSGIKQACDPSGLCANSEPDKRNSLNDTVQEFRANLQAEGLGNQLVRLAQPLTILTHMLEALKLYSSSSLNAEPTDSHAATKCPILPQTNTTQVFTYH